MREGIVVMAGPEARESEAPLDRCDTPGVIALTRMVERSLPQRTCDVVLAIPLARACKILHEASHLVRRLRVAATVTVAIGDVQRGREVARGFTRRIRLERRSARTREVARRFRCGVRRRGTRKMKRQLVGMSVRGCAIEPLERGAEPPMEQSGTSLPQL